MTKLGMIDMLQVKNKRRLKFDPCNDFMEKVFQWQLLFILALFCCQEDVLGLQFSHSQKACQSFNPCYLDILRIATRMNLESIRLGKGGQSFNRST